MSFDSAIQSMLGSLANCRGSTAAEFELRALSEEVMLSRSLEVFQGLYATKAVLYPHQVAVAHQVLTGNPNGAILADEVGLGKTIEAGLILKELRLRDKANRVLIVAPQHLLGQWQGELREKFDLESQILDTESRALLNKRQESWWGPGITLVSLQMLARLDGKPLRELREFAFDVLIVDEAHRVRNRNSKAHRALRDVRRERTLLLTATPIQTRVSDLLSLVQLVDPYALTDNETEALAAPVVEADALESLRVKLAGLVIRNRRVDVQLVGLVLPPREANIVIFTLPEDEALLRESVNTYARARFESVGKRGSLDLIALERLMASHPRALEEGLRRRLTKAGGSAEIDDNDDTGEVTDAPVDAATLRDLVLRVSKVTEGEKARQLAAALNDLFERDPLEKVLVFSEFLDSLEALQIHLQGEGIAVHRFDGSVKPADRQNQLAEFWARGQVLLLSEAGSEGQNLQRARIVVNFDLPWNPMRLEQRIGRVHRIGQKRPVKVLNFVAKGTIEERLIDILQKRINLFTGVIGELDAIIGELESGISLEERLLELSLAQGERAEQLETETSERIQEVARQFRLSEGLDRRVIEKFDLSLQTRYLELDGLAREGLDHLPLRRFLKAYVRAIGADWNPDDEVFTLEGQLVTLRGDVAADGRADLLHPMHVAVQGLLLTARGAGDVAFVQVNVSGSAMIVPEGIVGKRGFLVLLKASWSGDANDERLYHVFISDHLEVHLELMELMARARVDDAPELRAASPDAVFGAQKALEAAIPELLAADRERLRLESLRRFEILARNIEAFFAESIEKLENEWFEHSRKVRNARLSLHHTADTALRDANRDLLRELEIARDRRGRELLDQISSFCSDRDRRVRDERSRLKLEERISLIAMAVVELI